MVNLVFLLRSRIIFQIFDLSCCQAAVGRTVWLSFGSGQGRTQQPKFALLIIECNSMQVSEATPLFASQDFGPLMGIASGQKLRIWDLLWQCDVPKMQSPWTPLPLRVSATCRTGAFKHVALFLPWNPTATAFKHKEGYCPCTQGFCTSM